ncbi:hypothetical protein ETAA8_61980 [Anatilimnocola aggregata]|uniref:Uncharacterized protein n=1 Tax=Anatilimnocola aggregata TaxID=2528021 RepID=A0A517YLD5_9BACT|nr:hypothetical protein [Anatilimnocola aggregata]QDU31045.1 hypothetical protein ETAA8_61980 [Anatilimnocola aggregata]
MAQKRRAPIPNKRQVARAPQSEVRRSLLASPVLMERAEPIVYGKPFIVAEDSSKNTFVYKQGAWVPHDSIAEIRKTCLVKELPQRLNNMIRYEVRAPE